MASTQKKPSPTERTLDPPSPGPPGRLQKNETKTAGQQMKKEGHVSTKNTHDNNKIYMRPLTHFPPQTGLLVTLDKAAVPAGGPHASYDAGHNVGLFSLGGCIGVPDVVVVIDTV
jgi:hypothetical protein